VELRDDIAFDLTELDSAMADVEQRGKRLAPAFRELRRPLRGDQREHAKDQRGPDGSWPPRSPFTEARQRARNRAIRRSKAAKTIAIATTKRRSTPARILGRLPGAIKLVTGELFVRAVSRVPWSGVHQFGGRAGRGVRIPARPFLWLSDGLLELARTTLADFVVKGWKR
jgi:phage gpG-like protein